MEQGQDPSPVLCTPSAARITSLPWLSKTEGPGGSMPSSAVSFLMSLGEKFRDFHGRKLRTHRLERSLEATISKIKKKKCTSSWPKETRTAQILYIRLCTRLANQGWLESESKEPMLEFNGVLIWKLSYGVWFVMVVLNLRVVTFSAKLCIKKYLHEICNYSKITVTT